MDRRVTPPRRVTSVTWGPTPPCKKALNSTLEKNRTTLFSACARNIAKGLKALLGSFYLNDENKAIWQS